MSQPGAGPFIDLTERDSHLARGLDALRYSAYEKMLRGETFVSYRGRGSGSPTAAPQQSRLRLEQ